MIQSKAMIKEYLLTSNLKYNNHGEMYFTGDFYLTQWCINQNEFSSNTVFSDHETEGFLINQSSFNTEETNWHEFGFSQTFKDEENDKNISPFHKNKHFELYYVSSGSFEIKIEDRYITLVENDMILINDHTFHSDVIHDDSLELYILGINQNIIDQNINDQMSDEMKHFFYTHSFSEHSEAWLFKKLPSYTTVFSEIFSELELKSFYFLDIVKFKVARMLSELSYHDDILKNKSSNKGRKTILFNEVDQYMRTHYQKMSLDDLSGHMKFSKDYFNRLIKEITNKTYTEYLQEIRIEKAAELLLHTDLSVTDVGLAVGYSNMSHFYDVFRSFYNMTPNEYRNTI